MTTRLLLAMLVSLIAMIAPQTASAAVIEVAPGGNLTTAYNSAASGDTIQLSTGVYGSWVIPSGTKVITVKGSDTGRSVFRQLGTSASNVTFDKVHVDGAGTYAVNRNAALFETHGVANITYKNGSIGNVMNQKGAVLGGTSSAMPLNIVIDNVRFYGVNYDNNTIHSECIFSQVPGLVVRNSTFESLCGTSAGLVITRGDWWGQPMYTGGTFENNTFHRQIADHGGIAFGNACSGCSGFTIKGNTFLHPTAMPVAWSGNTFAGSTESCNSPQVNLPNITHAPCNPTPTPTPTATPSPTPTPTPTATPSPTPTPTAEPTPTATPTAEPTPTPTAEPTPEPYAPACAPTCDEQIAALEAKIRAAQEALD